MSQSTMPDNFQDSTTAVLQSFNSDRKFSLLIWWNWEKDLKVRDESHYQVLGQMYATIEKSPLLQSATSGKRSRQQL